MLPSSISSAAPLLEEKPAGRGSRRDFRSLRRPAIYLPFLATVVLVLLIVTRQDSADPASDTTSTFRIPSSFHRSVDHFASSFLGRRPQVSLGAEWDCNPFEQPGRLIVDGANIQNNKWVPYDSTCRPSAYLNDLWRADGDDSPLIPRKETLERSFRHGKSERRDFLPWLMNRTVIIQGDSIDRFRLKDFCKFVRGDLFVVSPDHIASPPPFKEAHRPELGEDGRETPESMAYWEERQKKEHDWEARPRDGIELTSPWVCDIKEYGTTFINVFAWGLRGAENYFEKERWYHPPATWTDRMDHITQPVLDRLSKFLDRPNVQYPDLVQINSGFWDLRRFTEEDFVAAGFTSRPYPEDSVIPYSNLSPEREQDWEREARKAIKHTARTFRSKDGSIRRGPSVVWRTLHHPHRHNYAPYPRVFALDSLAMKVIADLKEESGPHHHRRPSLPEREQFDNEGPPTDDLGLDERLRIDYSGQLLRGQELHFRDLLHQAALPGSWLWSNVILYELKRAAKHVGRSGAE